MRYNYSWILTNRNALLGIINKHIIKLKDYMPIKYY